MRGGEERRYSREAVFQTCGEEVSIETDLESIFLIARGERPSAAVVARVVQ